jgi:hypothetical protein
MAIVFILWIRIALRDAYTTTSPALGARRVATQEGLSTWTAMLPVPGKSSGKCGGTTILCCAASFSKRRRLLTANPLSQPSESAGQRHRVATGIGATELRSGPNDATPSRSGLIQPERVEPDHIVDAEIIFRIVALHVVVPDI